MPDKEIDLESYNYALSEERIARYPLPERTNSKLLLYDHGRISHHIFRDLPDLLPDESFLFFNESRVIPARLVFSKSTGATIEIFLLNPVRPSTVMSIAMETKKKTTWKCLIKNLRKWKGDLVLQKIIPMGSDKSGSWSHHDEIRIKAVIENREQQLVSFSWEKDVTFAQIIEESGEVPLPPYLKREPVPADRSRYQTVYSKIKGAVAAPTAGLHFTDQILEQLSGKGHVTDFLTLHVSAGTFQPIKEKKITRHAMHREQIRFTRRNILNLIHGRDKVIAVGTTSLRTIESIYWYGIKLLSNKNSPLFIEKLFPYQFSTSDLPSPVSILQNILDRMDLLNVDELWGETEIFIFPGYSFRICKGLITNFHMPRSTLILLVAAFTGNDWREIYQEALAEDYRFLSYGDSSLLLP